MLSSDILSYICRYLPNKDLTSMFCVDKSLSNDENLFHYKVNNDFIDLVPTTSWKDTYILALKGNIICSILENNIGVFKYQLVKSNSTFATKECLSRSRIEMLDYLLKSNLYNIGIVSTAFFECVPYEVDKNIHNHYEDIIAQDNFESFNWVVKNIGDKRYFTHCIMRYNAEYILKSGYKLDFKYKALCLYDNFDLALKFGYELEGNSIELILNEYIYDIGYDDETECIAQLNNLIESGIKVTNNDILISECSKPVCEFLKKRLQY